MSFNVRGSFRDQGTPNAWPERAALNVETIGRSAPDVIGFQELQSGNLETYREGLPRYDRLPGPEYGNQARPSLNAIFFAGEVLRELGLEGRPLRELGVLRVLPNGPVLPAPEHAPRPCEQCRAPRGQQPDPPQGGGALGPLRRGHAGRRYGGLQLPARKPHVPQLYGGGFRRHLPRRRQRGRDQRAHLPRLRRIALQGCAPRPRAAADRLDPAQRPRAAPPREAALHRARPRRGGVS